MQSFIIEIMTKWGFLGVFLLIAAENLFPPIPSEVILTFAGFLTTVTSLSTPGMILFATVGSLAGALIIYSLGRFLSAERVEALVKSRLGQALRFDLEDIEKARDKFVKKGYLSVPICHCVPILRSLISIPAGMARMPLPLFVLLTTIGSAVWNTVLIFLGAFAGSNWQSITGLFSSASGIIKPLLVVGAALLGFFWLRKIKKEKQPQ